MSHNLSECFRTVLAMNFIITYSQAFIPFFTAVAPKSELTK